MVTAPVAVTGADQALGAALCRGLSAGGEVVAIGEAPGPRKDLGGAVEPERRSAPARRGPPGPERRRPRRPRPAPRRAAGRRGRGGGAAPRRRQPRHLRPRPGRPRGRHRPHRARESHLADAGLPRGLRRRTVVAAPAPARRRGAGALPGGTRRPVDRAHRRHRGAVPAHGAPRRSSGHVLRGRGGGRRSGPAERSRYRRVLLAGGPRPLRRILRRRELAHGHGRQRAGGDLRRRRPRGRGDDGGPEGPLHPALHRRHPAGADRGGGAAPECARAPAPASPGAPRARRLLDWEAADTWEEMLRRS